MPYESPQNAQDETFVEAATAKVLHSKTVPTSWKAINEKGATKGGVYFQLVSGTVLVSQDGSTTLCSVSAPVYLPLTFPFYVKALGSKTSATIVLLNHTLGGATVRRG